MPNFIEIGVGSRKFSKKLVDLTRNDPQQIKIANYKNIFLMPIKSNCRLRIINGPSEKLESSGFGAEGIV